MTTPQAPHVRQALDQVRQLKGELQRLQRQLSGPVLPYSRAAHVQSLGPILHRIALQLEFAASTLLAGDDAPVVLPLRNVRPAATVQRYERQPKARTAGRWITLGAQVGDDGQKHGGSPVFIEGGRITKGHPSLTGRKIDALREEPVEVSGRKQRDWARGYERSKWGKQARQADIDPDDLHQLAAEILEHDKAFVSDRTHLLQRARQLSERLGYGSLQGLNLRTGRGIDADAVPGLDDVAERLAEEYPDHFAGHGEPSERLFDLLAEGNPKPMSEDAAYRQAFGHLSEGPESDAEELEPAPFNRTGRPLRVGLLKGPERYALGDGPKPGGAPLLPGPPKPQTPAGILQPGAGPAKILPPRPGKLGPATPLKPVAQTVTTRPPVKPPSLWPQAELLPQQPKPPSDPAAGKPPAVPKAPTATPAGLELPDYAQMPVLSGMTDEEANHLVTRQTHLSTSPLVGWKNVGTGRSVSVRVHYHDGTHGLYKPRSGEADLRIAIPAGSLYKREVVASLTARLMGWGHLVPVTAFRRHDERLGLGIREDVGSVMDWVGGFREASRYGWPNRYDGDEDAARAAVLDYLFWNTDRHPGQWGFPGGQTGDPVEDLTSRAKELFRRPTNIKMADHGYTYPVDYHLNDLGHVNFWGWAAEKRFPMPDVSRGQGKANQYQALMEWAGLEPNAVQLAMERFAVVQSGRYDRVASLPAPKGMFAFDIGGLAVMSYKQGRKH